MTRNTFERILRNLHLCDNEELYKEGKFLKLLPVSSESNRRYLRFSFNRQNKSIVRFPVTELMALGNEYITSQFKRNIKSGFLLHMATQFSPNRCKERKTGCLLYSMGIRRKTLFCGWWNAQLQLLVLIYWWITISYLFTFHVKTPSQMFDKILSSSLKPVTTWLKNSTSDV